MAQGIRSVLSSPLMTADQPQGALKIYSNTVRAFGEHEQQLAGLFATQASQVLTTAGREGRDEQSNARSAGALETRQTIARAEGMIMARDDVRGAIAADNLRRMARDAAATVAEYATQLTESVGNNIAPEP